jgi:hypothetical protein
VIRSRVFVTFFSILLTVLLLTYSFVDFRDKEDKAYSYYKDAEYEKVLSLYAENDTLETELVIALLSQSVSHLESKLNDTKTKDRTLSFLKKHGYLKLSEWETPLGKYTHIEDPYFPLLKKHANHYKKALITKASTIQKLIPKDKVSFYLLQLILEDPRGLEESYSIALANLLRFPFDPIGEIESNFLLETLSFLSSSSLSLFYENLHSVTGKNVNLRSGPGKENKEVGKVSSPDLTFCFEKDNHQETVSGKSGVFVQCFYPHLGKSAWIFSGFLEKELPDASHINHFEKRFKAVENEIKIDFVSWLGEKIPPTFYGTYIPRERLIESGEVGFPLYGNKSKEYRKICKKIAGEKNHFEFSFLPDESEMVIGLFDLNLVYSGGSHLAYAVEVDHQSIYINRNRYILDEDRKRENLSLHIESREDNKLVGSLWRRNTGLLQSLKSVPIDMSVFSSGKYSWELCLPLATSPTKDKAILFEIKTGVH